MKSTVGSNLIYLMGSSILSWALRLQLEVRKKNLQMEKNVFLQIVKLLRKALKSAVWICPILKVSKSLQKTMESLINKVNLQCATLSRKKVWHRCIPVYIGKVSRTPFMEEHFEVTVSE